MIYTRKLDINCLILTYSNKGIRVYIVPDLLISGRSEFSLSYCSLVTLETDILMRSLGRTLQCQWQLEI